MASEDGRKLKDDSFAYLMLVKEVFQDKMISYRYFLEIMKDYKEKRIDTEGVIAKVKELFEGHEILLLGFNNFVPSPYAIKVPLTDEPSNKMLVGPQITDPLRNGPLPIMRRHGGYEEAAKFVNKVQARFQRDRRIYDSFLDIVNKFGEGKKSMAETYQEVAALLKGHADLQNELTQFLPGIPRAA